MAIGGLGIAIRGIVFQSRASVETQARRLRLDEKFCGAPSIPQTADTKRRPGIRSAVSMSRD